MTTVTILPLGLATYAFIAGLASRALEARGHVLSRRVTPTPDTVSFGIAATANLAIGGAVILEHWWLARRPLVSLGLALLPRQLHACVAAFALTFVLAAAHARRLRGTARPCLSGRSGPTLFTALIALACGAWMEEIVFRAFAFAWLHPYGDAFALITSALVFVLVHVPTSRTDRWALINWLVGGLALGGIYMVTGSVWIATAAHLARNVANVLWVEPATRACAAPSAPARSAYYAVLSAATFAAAWAVR